MTIRADRMALHDQAVAAGEPGYIDPDSGLFVMTAAYLRDKGPCCSSGCRHCPYRERSGPQRIVSLLPAATDILWFLGVGERVAGVTYECTVPDGETLPPKVTDTIIPIGAEPAEIDRLIAEAVAENRPLYQLDRDVLGALEPDLIVTQDLCRVCALPAGEAVDAVTALGCEVDVFTYDPMSLDDVIDGIEKLAVRVGAGPEGFTRVQRLRERVAASRTQAAAAPARPRVLLLEWPDPPYGPGHWIPDQIEAAGGVPVLANPGGRSAAVSWDDVAASAAEVVIVAPCGFDADAATEQLESIRNNPAVAHLPAAASGRLHAMDGDRWIVRPGPGLVDGVRELARIIQPDSTESPDSTELSDSTESPDSTESEVAS